MNPTVTLTAPQMVDVARVAARVMDRYVKRKVAAMRFREPNLQRFTASFGAELAVALLAGQRWNRGDPRKADVGEDIEARWTSKTPPELRLYDPRGRRSQDRGKLDSTFVLVTGWPPRYTVHGSATGHQLLTGEARRSPEGTTSYYLGAWQLQPFPPGCVLHGWGRDLAGIWRCVRCDEHFVGPVPVDELHPTGWQT